MNKLKYFLVGAIILCMCGCNKTNDNSFINSFEKKVLNSKSYVLKGKMEIVSKDDSYYYDVIVKYKYDDNYNVNLVNSINEHEQVILKNSEGVYVVTPSLNKSFKFQSNWPHNSSQSYLLHNIVNDIKNTSDAKIESNKEYNIVVANVKYPNNIELVKEKIYFDKKNNLKEVQVIDNNDNIAITMKFNKINFNEKLSDDDFSLDNLIKDSCLDESCDKEDMESSIIDDIVYPLYLPENTHLKTKDTLNTENGQRVIMTYAGDKPFMLIEELSSINKEMEITSINGDPLMLSMGIGALSSNSLEWQSGNVDYYLTSSYLTSDELVTIAESLNTSAVIEITNK